MVVFIFSISAVCAQDANQTGESDISLADESVLSNSSVTSKTFADLDNNISSAGSEWNMSSDYKFNDQYDKKLCFWNKNKG